MSTAVDPNARIISPNGLPLAILVLSAVFLGLSLVTVALRTYTRLAKGIFGWDDTFVLIGSVSLTTPRCTACVGVSNSDIC